MTTPDALLVYEILGLRLLSEDKAVTECKRIVTRIRKAERDACADVIRAAKVERVKNHEQAVKNHLCSKIEAAIRARHEQKESEE
jgi:hypothetical protein